MTIPTTFHDKQRYKHQLTQLTPFEKDVLYGMVLGDATIRKTPGAINALVQFRQSRAQKALIDELWTIFRPYSWQKAPRLRTSGLRAYPTQTYYALEFDTFTHPLFTVVYDHFYVLNPTTGRRIKRIPNGIEAWLTPRVLAYHVMCDGSFQRNELILHTHSFAASDCVRYVTTLNGRFGLHGKVRLLRNRGTSYPIIVFPSKDVIRLQVLLQPYTLPSFYYKLGLRT